MSELNKALAAAQGMMKAATYNKTNPHFKSKYADLAAVWDAIREPLSKNGLSITQTMERSGDATDPRLDLVTTLRHLSGECVSSIYPLPQGSKPQEFGSALTYARRYSLSSIVGIAADEDDDANEAQAGHKPTGQAQALFEQLKAEILVIDSVVELGKWGADQGKRSYDLPQDLQRQFRAVFNGRKAAIEANTADAERAKSERIE